ncbi:HNH endonuclease [Halostella pelagica]|uniref:HNH endonuclease n=1 Tax=Halostella pelagica TaxID=2583824 RepID=UPI0010803A14
MSDDGGHECPTCEREFETRRGLGQHHASKHGESLREHESSGGHECPTCGEEFSSDRGMKTHHAQAHGESLALVTSKCENCGETYEEVESRAGIYCSVECRIEGQSDPMVTKTCQYCEEEFELKKYRAESDLAKYCGRSCAGKAKTGEEANRWEGGPPDEICEWCGKEFESTPGNPNRFCSLDCEGEWRSNSFKGENHPNWDSSKKIVDCEWCGNEFREQTGNPNRFCSRICKHEYQASPDGWTWKGGPQPYGEGWNDKKKAEVRSRDGHKCQSCGLSQESHLDQYDFKLHVHHITPARKFDNSEERNAMTNLVTLCIRCHNEWEQMAPLRPDTAEPTDD